MAVHLGEGSQSGEWHDIPVEDIWGKLPFSEYYENLQRMINAGGI